MFVPKSDAKILLSKQEVRQILPTMQKIF